MIKHCVFCVHRDERRQREECIEQCLPGAGCQRYALFTSVSAAWAKDSDRLWAALEWLLQENDARLMEHREFERRLSSMKMDLMLLEEEVRP